MLWFGMLRRKCDPDPIAIRRCNRWTMWMGGLGMGFEWLAGLVWKGLGCVGFVYKIVKITAAGSNNGTWWPSAWALMYGTE